MGKAIKIMGLFFLLSSCIQHKGQDEQSKEIFSPPEVELTLSDAEGFDMVYSDTCTKIVTHSIAGNSFFRDSIYLLHEPNVQLPSSSKTLRSPLKRVCSQSSTHLAYIHVLDQISSVKGFCGLQYLRASQLKNILSANGVAEICQDEMLQREVLLELGPELFFAYPFGEDEKSDLDREGIPTLMIAEYLEQHPIARLEWIKLFGVLYDRSTEANDYFEKTKASYEALVQEKVDTNKQFIFNLPYGDSWYTPSSNSLVVQLLEDAGLYYYFREDQPGTENTPHTKEEIWEAGGEANYWVIIADRPEDFTLKDLIAEEEAYQSFKSVVSKQVIFCNSQTTDYFVDGILEPDIMLKDLLFATHKIDQHTPKYFKLLR